MKNAKYIITFGITGGLLACFSSLLSIKVSENINGLLLAGVTAVCCLIEWYIISAIEKHSKKKKADLTSQP